MQMIINYKEIITGFLILWPILSWLHYGLDNFNLKRKTKVKSYNINKWSFIWNIIYNLMICKKCLSFWIILGVTGNFITASAVSLLMFFIEGIENQKTKL